MKQLTKKKQKTAQSICHRHPQLTRTCQVKISWTCSILFPLQWESLYTPGSVHLSCPEAPVIAGTASIEEVDNLIRRWEQMLLACNKLTVLVDEPNYRLQERMLIHMRRMMMRAGPSLREVGFLHGFLTTVNTITSSIASSQLKRQPSNTSQLNP
jgi:hypothetical protein